MKMITNIYKRLFQSEPEMYSNDELEGLNVVELLQGISNQQISRHNFACYLSLRVPSCDIRGNHVLLIEKTQIQCWDIIKQSFVLYYNITDAIGLLDNQSEHVICMNPNDSDTLLLRINIKTNHLDTFKDINNVSCFCASPIDDTILFIGHKDQSISLLHLDTKECISSFFKVDFDIYTIFMMKHVLYICSPSNEYVTSVVYIK